MSMLPIYISNIADEYTNKLDWELCRSLDDHLEGFDPDELKKNQEEGEGIDTEGIVEKTKITELIEEAMYKAIEEYKKSNGHTSN